MKRTRQSNPDEYCPACGIRLANRASAVSHYRAHGRRGELLERAGNEFMLPGLYLGVELWWRKGMAAMDRLDRLNHASVVAHEQAQHHFIARLYKNRR
jgi:hypothetical protein